MKRKMVLFLTAAFLSSAIVSGGAYAASRTSAAANARYIGEASAEAIALEDAGVTAEEATDVTTHLDRDDGRRTYDVRFYSGDTKYDYEIDAETGDIIEYDYKRDYRSAARSNPASANTAAVSEYIGKDAAKAIALEDAGVAETDVTRMDIDLDREDGVMVYEVEFNIGWEEYDYEIDALDGTLLKSSVEFDD